MQSFFFFSEKPNKIVIQRVGDRDAADHITASAGDDLEMECIATGGNPPPTLRWYMDDLEIRSGHTQENSRPSGNTVRTWTSISRLVLPVSKSDDGTTIRCKAEHPALQEPLSARKFLTIHCKLCSEYYIVFWILNITVVSCLTLASMRLQKNVLWKSCYSRISYTVSFSPHLTSPLLL